MDRNIIDQEAKYLVPTYKRPDVVFVRGQGAYLFDSEGKRYLDFASGIAVNALGHADPAWVAALTTQAGELGHVSNLYHSKPHVDLARTLVESCFADRVFFCNSGAEANEAALKFARKRSHASNRRGKTVIVAFENGFHGRTLGALSVTHNPAYREPFEPLVPNIRFAPFNDVDAAYDAIRDDTCAVIVEPIQGEGGVHPATKEFLQTLRDRSRAVDASLIFDEVQCGLGRTGHLWAHQALGVEPDMMTIAKPLANGLPIGATLVTEQVSSFLKPGDHGSTFAAGPVLCKAAQVVLDRVRNPEFLGQVQRLSRYLLERLDPLRSRTRAIRGAGLLLGIEFDQPVAPLVNQARRAGLIVISAGPNVLRLAPPLIITEAEVDWCVDVLDQCLLDLDKDPSSTTQTERKSS